MPMKNTVVYTEFSSVAADLGIPTRTLFAVSNRLSAHYHKVSIPKKDGGTRELSVPDEPLKRIQRAIAEKLLGYVPLSPYATAYRPGACVQKNAAPHVGRDVILKLDIQHFFDSILYTTVKEKCFPADCFSEPIRVLLSLLCYCGDSLPQGAPTSPVITNIILKEFDETVGEFCRCRGVSYTRYCDDMTLSWMNTSRVNARELIAFVKGELFRNGLLLNPRKTAMITDGRRQTVTGLVVNQKLNISGDYRRQIRQQMHFCRQFGVRGHLAAIRSDTTPTGFLHRLLGQIAFVLSVRPDDNTFLQYRAEVRRWLTEEEQKEQE